jgi:hypothetical protein
MEEKQAFPIKKTPVILTIIFDFLTGGIYSASWFLIRRQGFNLISRSKKLGLVIPIICLIMLTLNIMLSFAGGFIAGIAEAIGDNGLIVLAHQIDMVCTALAYVGGFLLLVPSFKAMSMLEAFLKDQDRFALSLSGAATFFFRIYYLQYRINKIHKEASIGIGLPIAEEPSPLSPRVYGDPAVADGDLSKTV